MSNTNRENLLFISAHLPSPDVPQAGQKIAHRAVCEYADKYNVYLVTFFNEAEASCARGFSLPCCKDVAIFPVTKWSRAVGFLFHPHLPLKASVRYSSAAVRYIQNLLRTVKFTVVHCEFTAAARYLEYIDGSILTVVTEHDITYQSFERKAEQSTGFFKHFYRFEAKRQKRWELSVLNTVDDIVVLSEKDRQIIADDGIPLNRVRVSPPAIDPAFRDLDRSLFVSGSLLFWGAMDRPENVDAAVWFVKYIYPKIVSKCSFVKLYIVGASPPEAVKTLTSPTIIVTGFVEDPLEYFRKCHIGIAPLRIGAGIKLKVLEYLEAGLPVVATGVGAEGIDSPFLFIADNEETFAEKIIELINSENHKENTSLKL